MSVLVIINDNPVLKVPIPRDSPKNLIGFELDTHFGFKNDGREEGFIGG